MSSDYRTQEAVKTDRSSGPGGSAMEECLTHRQGVFDGPRGQATTDDLPDDALLVIFGFYLDDKKPFDRYGADKWHTLVHVCRRWRSVVFASPRHLNLRLLCTGGRSVRAMLDIWPALPIQIDYYRNWRASEMGMTNILTALEHPDRVRHISIFNFPGTWKALAAAMRVSFPELTFLRLWPCDTFTSIIPGGSAQRLRTLSLSDVPFPAVRGLLLSVGDLTHLTLSRLEYVSPKLIVACLSSLKRLESLWLGIEPPQFHPDQPSPPPQELADLPALAEFTFIGRSEHLEDFVARIDTPVLSRVYTGLGFDSDVFFAIPHFIQFIGRARGFKPSKAPRILFQSQSSILLEFSLGGPTLTIHRHRTDWGISSIALICGQLSPFFSFVERLDLIVTYSPFRLRGIDRMESTIFLELFRPFTAIRSLYVSKSLVPLIAPALQELIGERVTEVLPNLRDLFLGGPVIAGSVQEAMQPFVDARQLSGRPIAIHRWVRGKGANW